MYTFFFFPSKGQGGYWLFTPIEECSSDLPALWAHWVILGGGGWSPGLAHALRGGAHAVRGSPLPTRACRGLGPGRAAVSGSRRGPRGQARTSDGGRGLGLRRVLRFSSQHIQPGRRGTATCRGPLGPLAHLGPPDLRQGPGSLSPDPAPHLGGLPSPHVSPMDAAQPLRCSASPDTSKTFPTPGWGIL